MKRPFSSISDLREHGCGRIRKLLDSFLAGELTVESNHEILEHTESCMGCSSEADVRGRLRTAIRRIGGELPEPRPGFEAEVRARLAASPAPSGFRGAPATLLVAAVLLLGAGLMVFVVRPGTPSRGTDVLARRAVPSPADAPMLDLAAFDVVASAQLRCADASRWPDAGLTAEDFEKSLLKGDARFARVGRELIAKLGSGYRVVAAHRCSHDGPLVVHLVLKGNGPGLLSVVAFPKIRGRLPVGPGSLQGVDQAGRPVLLVRAEREGVHMIGAEGDRDLFFVSASRGGAEDTQIELGRRLLPFLTSAIVTG